MLHIDHKCCFCHQHNSVCVLCICVWVFVCLYVCVSVFVAVCVYLCVSLSLCERVLKLWGSNMKHKGDFIYRRHSLWLKVAITNVRVITAASSNSPTAPLIVLTHTCRHYSALPCSVFKSMDTQLTQKPCPSLHKKSHVHYGNVSLPFYRLMKS